MPAAPAVSWFYANNTSVFNDWQIGVVDAGGAPSPELNILVWNNRGNTTDPAPDMTATTFTTKDNGGGDTGPLITGTWTKLKCNTKSGDDFTSIGGTVMKSIKAGGSVTTDGLIKGSTNGGTLTGADQNNFANLSIRVEVPSLATAGNIAFKLRVAYQYTGV